MSTTAEQNTKLVWEFYDLAFNRKEPEAAAERYLGAAYRQHNPMAPDGAQPFIGFVRWLTGANPSLRVERKRSIAEGDLVALHSHMIPSPGARGTAVIDIFRLNADGKIVEHWDVLQEVPETAQNPNTMF
jgi:predicted SnoaL-like aldol condensation-catalyzing enzyme